VFTIFACAVNLPAQIATTNVRGRVEVIAESNAGENKPEGETEARKTEAKRPRQKKMQQGRSSQSTNPSPARCLAYAAFWSDPEIAASAKPSTAPILRLVQKIRASSRTSSSCPPDRWSSSQRDPFFHNVFHSSKENDSISACTKPAPLVWFV